jgi:GTPase
MIPTIVIAGRPNVGKSTLFNRLVGNKLALVDDSPGVTRDRREGLGKLADLTFTLVDTAGLGEVKKETLEARMSAQSELAVKAADVILFIVDARTGITEADKTLAAKIRKFGRPTILLANKCESRVGRDNVSDAFSLGLGEPLPISAEHGEGLDLIYDALVPFVSAGEEPEKVSGPDQPLKLAIIGQPNAGKSTLVNAMLGEERMLTGPEAGITRDAIVSNYEYRGRKIKLWDTAGIRRKSRVQQKLEKLSVADAMRAIKYAECVVVMVDATMKIERQDLTLCDLVAREGRAVVLALSKWDAVEEKVKVLKDVQEDLESVLPEIRGVQIVTVSGKQERGINKLMDAVLKADERWNSRTSTGKLNRWLEQVLQRNAPPAPSGRRIKIRYMTQASARPPTFALFGNQLKKLPDSYIRYLTNNMRDDFGLEGTPIRISLRGGKNPFEE